MRWIIVAAVLLLAGCGGRISFPVVQLDPVVDVPTQDIGKGTPIAFELPRGVMAVSDWKVFTGCIQNSFAPPGRDRHQITGLASFFRHNRIQADTEQHYISIVLADRVRAGLSAQNFQLANHRRDAVATLNLRWEVNCYILGVTMTLLVSAERDGQHLSRSFEGSRPPVVSIFSRDSEKRLNWFEAAMTDAIRLLVLDNTLTTFLATGKTSP